ncbi:hypothetical protein [Aerosakkonema funiforme]|nr:hypothetical protein [Aerosakkonema funiforme]
MRSVKFIEFILIIDRTPTLTSSQNAIAPSPYRATHYTRVG